MHDARPDAPLGFLGDPLPRWVDRRAVTIEPGDTRAYDEAEWRDALVIVEQGEVVLECARGGFTTFRAGDLLWLVDVPLRTIHNRGIDPAVIVAISRRHRNTDHRGTDSLHERNRRMDATPVTELDPRFSSDGAAPTSWPEARQQLADAETFWISTVRPDGRPHVTPLMAVLIDDALFFCTGADERKARNLESNPHVAMTTGSGPINQGRDLVVEGKAVRVTDEATLRRAVERYRSKYGWSFDVAGDVIRSADGGGDAYLFRVQPRQAFGFGKGEPYSQTRWTFR